MAKKCAVTGTRSAKAGGYSNRVRATQFNPTGNRQQKANLQKKRVFVPETGKSYTLTLSTRALKTINKVGAFKVLKKAGVIK